jgi:hypothetical protein
MQQKTNPSALCRPSRTCHICATQFAGRLKYSYIEKFLVVQKFHGKLMTISLTVTVKLYIILGAVPLLASLTSPSQDHPFFPFLFLLPSHASLPPFYFPHFGIQEKKKGYKEKINLQNLLLDTSYNFLYFVCFVISFSYLHHYYQHM